MAIITQSARLIIREFLLEEETLFLTLLTDPRLIAYLPKRNEEELAKKFKETIADYSEQVKLTRWAVFDVVDNHFIGLGILKQVDDEPGKAELGYVIHDQYKSRGIATELVNALLKYGFEEMRLKEIFAVTALANIASQRVLEKACLVKGSNITRNEEELTCYKTNSNEWLGSKQL